MKKNLFLIILVITIQSCIPLRIAPSIKSDKVMMAKKFKRKLPKQYALIFEDPKDANEFYDYINIKFQRNHLDVANNVPITIEGKDYFLSFLETEIPTKTLNFVPILIDGILVNKNAEPILEDAYMSRKGKWYLILLVTDNDLKDSVNPKYKHQPKVVKYLQNMRIEYLSTDNYLGLYFKSG